MKILKPSVISCSRKPVPVGGQISLVLTAMTGFSMQQGQPSLCSEQTLWSALGPVLPKATAPDLGFHKPRAEWLAFGRAFPAAAEAVSAKAWVRVERGGRVQSEKVLHISGRRHWQSQLGVAWPGEPEPLSEPLPLDWRRAYGGAGHAVNPQGIGYLGDEDWHGQPLPAIEYWNQLMAAPADRPPPAGFGPLPLDAPGRWKAAGTYDEHWQREVFPGLALDTPQDLFMLAASDQWLPEGIAPGDLIRCGGMRPGGEPLSWVMPGWQARCFIRYKGRGQPLRPVAMTPDTFLLLPEAGVLGVIWRGTAPIREPDAFDVGLLMMALEDLDAPKSLEHYQAYLDGQLGTQQQALLGSLDESALLPEGQVSDLLASMTDAMQEQIQLIRSQLDKGLAGLPGLPAADEVPTAGAELSGTPPEPDPDQRVVALTGDMMDLLEGPNPDWARLGQIDQEIRALNETARKEAVASLKAMLVEQGIDPEAMQREMAGPPSRHTRGLDEMLDMQAQFGPLDASELARFREQMMRLQEMALDRYRASAHWMPPGYPLHDPGLLGEQLYDLIRSGNSGRYARSADWLGVDLSGRDMNGVVLAGAFMDGADLSHASLIGADLSGVTLSGANLMGADFTDANLEGANLGGARLQGARFNKAYMKKVVLDKSQLDGAQFREAYLRESSFIATEMGTADFSGANLTECQWMGVNNDPERMLDLLENPPDDLDEILQPMDISGINATKANLGGLTLLGCQGVGARFAGASFEQASLVRCDLRRADFSGARFNKSSAVMGTRLAGSNFTRAELLQSCFRETDFSQCDFRGARLLNSMFTLGDLSRINAEGVDATGAFFDRADLSEASFISASLRGARFFGAGIQGTTFQASNVSHADFSQAVMDDKTSFADATTLRALMPKKPKD